MRVTSLKVLRGRGEGRRASPSGSFRPELGPQGKEPLELVGRDGGRGEPDTELLAMVGESQGLLWRQTAQTLSQGPRSFWAKNSLQETLDPRTHPGPPRSHGVASSRQGELASESLCGSPVGLRWSF